MERNTTMTVNLPHSFANHSTGLNMELKLLASLYPLVKDFRDAPLSPKVVSNGLMLEEDSVLPFFQSWVKEGILDKKYPDLHVYKLSETGYQMVQNAWLSLQMS